MSKENFKLAIFTLIAIAVYCIVIVIPLYSMGGFGLVVIFHVVLFVVSYFRWRKINFSLDHEEALIFNNEFDQAMIVSDIEVKMLLREATKQMESAKPFVLEDLDSNDIDIINERVEKILKNTALGGLIERTRQNNAYVQGKA